MPALLLYAESCFIYLLICNPRKKMWKEKNKLKGNTVSYSSHAFKSSGLQSLDRSDAGSGVSPTAPGHLLTSLNEAGYTWAPRTCSRGPRCKGTPPSFGLSSVPACPKA